KEIVPPVGSQTEIRKFTNHCAKRLVGIPACKKALKTELWMTTDKVRHLSYCPLRQSTACLVWQGLRTEAELINNFGLALFQGIQKNLIHIRGIYVSFARPCHLPPS